MRSLNLYKYYDKSLADLNRSYLEEKIAGKKKNARKGLGIRFIIGILVISILAIPVGIFLGTKLTKTAQQIVRTELNKPKPDMRTTEEKLGYVKVQIFEFADEVSAITEEPAVKEDKPKEEKSEAEELKAIETLREEITAAAEKKKKDSEPLKVSVQTAKEEQPVQNPAETVQKSKQEEVKKPVETPSPVKTAAPIQTEKKYSIVFENINVTEYNTVNSLAAKNKIVPNLADASGVTKKYWTVYRLVDSSSLQVGGKNVEKVQDFETKEEAVKYAKENNIKSVIRLEEIVDRKYTIKLCCTDIDIAKKIAESSNIRNKTIKIIREK